MESNFLLSKHAGECWSKSGIFADITEEHESKNLSDLCQETNNTDLTQIVTLDETITTPNVEFTDNALNEIIINENVLNETAINEDCVQEMPVLQNNAINDGGPTTLVVNTVNDLTEEEINNILLNFVEENQGANGDTTTIINIDNISAGHDAAQNLTMTDKNAELVLNYLKLALADENTGISIFSST